MKSKQILGTNIRILAPVTQLVEYRSYKPAVPGSIPGGSIKERRKEKKHYYKNNKYICYFLTLFPVTIFSTSLSC